MQLSLIGFLKRALLAVCFICFICFTCFTCFICIACSRQTWSKRDAGDHKGGYGVTEPGEPLRIRRDGGGVVWSGDALRCASSWSHKCLLPPPMGDASVPSLHPSHPRFTRVGFLGADRHLRRGGDACVALAGGERGHSRTRATQASPPHTTLPPPLRIRSRFRSDIMKYLPL